MTTRTQKAKLNIVSSLFAQISTLICGFIIPQLLIKTFGSEVYGATTSIANFLAYISLIEGGVAGVARAALYKPLAIGNIKEINIVYFEVKHFFNLIGFVFFVYTILIASLYNFIAKNNNFEWCFTFLLVVAISISSLGQYFCGISNAVLLQADQKIYIINILNVVTVIANAIFIIILTKLNYGVVWIKFVSSIIFLIRPLYLSIYVKNHYVINNSLKGEANQPSAITQKWTALGQHIAFFLHSNTDIAILTILSNLKVVAVYSVYNMIVVGLRNFLSSFYNGLESILGELYAKNENEKLQQVFGYYETLISVISVSILSCASAMIIPFVRIYTRGIDDINYIIPQLGFILIIAELVYTIRIPYHYMVNASGRFKQTKLAGYGEAGINIVLSILLVFKFGIVGVAIATLAATLFRGIYYAIYLSKHVMYRNFKLFINRLIMSFVLFSIISMFGYCYTTQVNINSYMLWIRYGFIMFVTSSIISIVINLIFYHNDLKEIYKRIRYAIHI